MAAGRGRHGPLFHGRPGNGLPSAWTWHPRPARAQPGCCMQRVQRLQLAEHVDEILGLTCWLFVTEATSTATNLCAIHPSSWPGIYGLHSSWLPLCTHNAPAPRITRARPSSSHPGTGPGGGQGMCLHRGHHRGWPPADPAPVQEDVIVCQCRGGKPVGPWLNIIDGTAIKCWWM